MSASTTYTALKDDTADRSLSYNERIFLHSCATGTALAHQKGGTKNKGDAISNNNNNSNSNSKNAETTGSILRTDGRHAGESRPIRLSFGRAHNMSECTVQLGANTRVSSSVSCHLIPPPHSDRPNDGSITFAVDLSPMSAMGFDYSQPASTMVGGGRGGDGSGSGGGMGQSQIESQKLLTNRILRILERTLLNGGAIDAEALCVQSGKWVWRLHIDVTVLDHGGNLVDACVLSAVAAMRHFRKPEVQINEDTVSVTTNAGSGNSGGSGGNGNDIIPSGPNVLHSDEREPTPLPLHHTPLTVTFALYADPTGATTTVSALIDPSQREELVMNGNVTFSFNKYGEMCSLDFAGGCELKPRQLITCAKLGKMKCVELCNMLESSLVEADQKSIEERLARLKVGAMSLGDIKNVPVPMPLPDVSTDVPFVERTDYDRDADMMEIDQDDLADIGSKEANKAAAIAAAEEESYRIQALDFASGHVAAKVKEGGRGGSGGGSGGTAAQGSTMKNGPMFGGSLMDAMLKSAEKISNDTMNNQDQSQEQEYGRTKVTASNHTEAADLEIAQLVAQETAKDDKKQTKSQSNSKTTSMVFDSDEEEETTTLHGEFNSKPVVEEEKEEPKPKKQKSSKTKSSSSSSKMDIDGDDDDVDLTMAIKKKSKKKTKKSKSKK